VNPATKLRILAINGSTLTESSNKRVLEFLKEHHFKEDDFEIYSAIDTLPHFNPALDGESLPSEIKELRAAIKEADAVIFCSPEYVFSLPGSFKNALDWLVSTVLLSEKPCAMIIAAASGKKAFEQLELILNTLQVKMIPSSQLLISGVKGKFDKNGQLTDEKLADSLNQLCESIKEISKKPRSI